MTIILPIGKPHPNGRGSNRGRVGVFGIGLHAYWEHRRAAVPKVAELMGIALEVVA
jgi:hypothetical protein